MVKGQSHGALSASRVRARRRALPTTFLLGIGIALAAPGDLDPDFGEGGLVSFKFSDFGGSTALAVLQQPDGTLVVAGFGDVIAENDDDWIVAKLKVDGTADSSFGSSGISTADYAQYFDAAYAVTRLDDGKLVLAGTVGVSPTESDFALARFSANGTLDATFGTGGWATVDLGGSDEQAFGLIRQADGKFVIAGYTNSGGTYQTAFVRFNPDGTLDTTFGTGGSTKLDFGSGTQSVAYALAQQSDGKLVASGTAFLDGGAVDVAIARISADGVPDPSFDGDGMVTIDVGDAVDEAFALAIQPDAAIVVAGYSVGAGSSIAAAGDHLNGLLIRLDRDGHPDPAFGTNGNAIVDLGAGAVFNGLALQADDGLVATGYRLSSEPYADMILARFHSNGALDGNFGIDGVATVDFGHEAVSADSWGNAVVQQIDGKSVIAGYNFNQGAFLVARLDDGPGFPGRIGLTGTSRFADETDATVVYSVRRTGGRSGVVSVDYATAAGTALPGSDFETVSGTLTWDDGETDQKTITINLVDDAEAESFEDFSLTLSEPTGGAQLAASKGTTTIASLDGPGQVGLYDSSTQSTVEESNRFMDLWVVRSTGSEGQVGVSFELGGGTATPGVDFSPSSGTVTWEDGEIGFKSIQVEIFDDTQAEGDETIPVRLLYPPTGGATLSGPEASILIVDDDLTGNETVFSLANRGVTVQESGNSAVLTVVRSGNTSGAATVNYTTSSGSATTGSDFTTASGTLQWAAGDSADQTISVSITNDTADEPDETFTVMLSNPSGGILGSISTAHVTIDDDDAPASGGVGGGGSDGDGDGGGGGGGGALDWLALLVLACLGSGLRLSAAGCSPFQPKAARDPVGTGH